MKKEKDKKKKGDLLWNILLFIGIEIVAFAVILTGVCLLPYIVEIANYNIIVGFVYAFGIAVSSVILSYIGLSKIIKIINIDK